MKQPNTHLGINPELCGSVVSLSEKGATVSLQTSAVMVADQQGLVHGGFVFGLADYAAMLAVNDPNVVLGAATTRFLAPVRCGDVVEAVATQTAESGRKVVVDVVARVGTQEVFTGTFTTFVLKQHVLSGRDS